MIDIATRSIEWAYDATHLLRMLDTCITFPHPSNTSLRVTRRPKLVSNTFNPAPTIAAGKNAVHGIIPSKKPSTVPTVQIHWGPWRII